jgi:tRNA-splicing ligase RtcB (3'-phosphate/5'-hydroxy nucleic acid ligase)
MANLKIFTKNIEQEALNQIYTLIEQPSFQDCKVRIMPDVHAGTGCVIGFTADLGDKVIPNIVGVDIGCGMLCVQLSEKDIDLQKLDDIIHNYVPNGREVHDVRKVKFDKLKDLYCYRNLKDIKRIEKSIGTLGGGNHFIEIDEDEEQNKYLIIHSGSRNLGKQVADYYQNLAIETMQGKDKLLEMQENLITEYKSQGKRKEIQSAIKELHKNFNPNPLKIPKELCYLTDKYREQYLHDMKICQEYAIENRATIADIILSLMNLSSEFSFETIHNYIEYKTNMIRKGAVSAKKDQMLLIPINMRDGCIVARGKGNDEWNQSAPHGAGRIMSRNKAREVVNFDDYKNSMNGIYTTSVNKETIDEAPMVYKPMKEIIDNIQDTVEIVKIIKPIYNFKASE